MKHKPDKYGSFADLKAGEDPKAYRIVPLGHDTAVAVAAPHGGKIEPGTSELARDIAGADLSLYLFEGCKANHNRDLHITSDRFDEPEGLKLIRKAQRVVTVHGESGDDLFVRVGGLDKARVTALRNALRNAGFETDAPANSQLGGTDPNNICNRGKSGAGVQLEISRGLRDALLGRDGSPAAQADALRDAFRRAVRGVLLAE